MLSALNLFGSTQEESERPSRKSQKKHSPPNTHQSVYPNIAQLPANPYPNQSRPPPPPRSVDFHGHTNFRPVNRLRNEEKTTRYPGSQLSRIVLHKGPSHHGVELNVHPSLLRLPPSVPRLSFQYEDQVLQDIANTRQLEKTREAEWEERRRARAESEERKTTILDALATTISTSFQPRPRAHKVKPESVSNVISGQRPNSKPKGESVDEYGVVPSSVVQTDSDGPDESQDGNEQKEGDIKSDRSASESANQQSSWPALSSFLPSSLSGDVYANLRISSPTKSTQKAAPSSTAQQSSQIQESDSARMDESASTASPVVDNLSKSERRRVTEFCRQTQADESTGLAYLMQYDWDLQLCIARFYDDNPDLKGRRSVSGKEEKSVDYATQVKELSSSALLAATDLSQRFLSSWNTDANKGSSET